MTQTWTVSSEAGDQFNGRTFPGHDDDCLAELKSAIACHYGDGDWFDVAPAGGNVPDADTRNAWEFCLEGSEDAIARIEPTA